LSTAFGGVLTEEVVNVRGHDYGGFKVDSVDKPLAHRDAWRSISCLISTVKSADLRPLFKFR